MCQHVQVTAAASPAPTQPSADLGHVPARAGLILSLLIAGAVVANVNTSISNVALPSIGRALQANDTELTAITDAFQLGIASTVLYLGAVGDRYGRKLLLLTGAALCVPFSLTSAFASSPIVLIGSQVAVGVACGMLYPTTLSLITSLWSGIRKNKAVALWTGVGAATPILGTLAGGWLLGDYWWGVVFLITVPFAILVFVVGWFVLPRHAGESDEPVDHPGGGLSVVMMSSFVVGIVLLPQGLTPVVVGLFVVALVTGALFVRRELRAQNPLFDLRAARIPTFWVAFVVGLIAFGALVGAIFIGQQFSQNVMGLSPFQAVLLVTGMAVALIPASMVAGRMVSARGSRLPFLLGLVIVGAGFVVMLIWWQPGVSLAWIEVAYLLIGVGIGLASTAAMSSLSGSLPIAKAGMSSGSADLTKDLGGAVFQALLGTVLAITYSSFFARAFAKATPEQAEALGSRAAQLIASSYEGAESVAATLPGAEAKVLISAAAQAFAEGKTAAIGWALASVIIGIVLVAWKFPGQDAERVFAARIQAENNRAEAGA